jgi:hypothetical protein
VEAARQQGAYETLLVERAAMQERLGGADVQLLCVSPAITCVCVGCVCVLSQPRDGRLEPRLPHGLELASLRHARALSQRRTLRACPLADGCAYWTRRARAASNDDGSAWGSDAGESQQQRAHHVVSVETTRLRTLVQRRQGEDRGSHGWFVNTLNDCYVLTAPEVRRRTSALHQTPSTTAMLVGSLDEPQPRATREHRGTHERDRGWNTPSCTRSSG